MGGVPEGRWAKNEALRRARAFLLVPTHVDIDLAKIDKLPE